MLLTLTKAPTILVAYQPKGNPMNEVMNKLMDLKQGIVDVRAQDSGLVPGVA